MNIIEITIGEKIYKISCNPGEESHIQKLSHKINNRYNNLRKNISDKASENLMLVIIALMLEDELSNNSLSSNNKAKISAISKKLEKIISKLEEAS
jgi:cell division protein ZapA (FtsZ GTPase activity inhibitor)